ncbi:hypothetical protein N7447_008885 [Penicillium robsamsonii]|uniref:uncharacterized protein n=1 Tax=Penicillium robsamsonii TaxID=1792511 RepID=UPI00254997E8|nr:uncharacterized protein N7447_008885 [Penicillium robsamsonii]KAJ5816652.1 hypothetical protein N7447_008885 [Penicillium robsamsonii]
MSLPSGCSVCGKEDGVLRCSGCKVMMYCDVEHQTAHRQAHKSACSAIRRCRFAMEKKEQALRAHPDDIFTHGECYNFLKWWATTGQEHNYDWGNNTLPYLDIKNANPLEPVDMFCDRMIDLPHMVAVTLVKIEVLQVFFINTGSLDGITADMLVFGLKSSTIAKNPNIANCDDGWLEVVKLKA